VLFEDLFLDAVIKKDGDSRPEEACKAKDSHGATKIKAVSAD